MISLLISRIATARGVSAKSEIHKHLLSLKSHTFVYTWKGREKAQTLFLTWVIWLFLKRSHYRNLLTLWWHVFIQLSVMTGVSNKTDKDFQSSPHWIIYHRCKSLLLSLNRGVMRTNRKSDLQCLNLNKEYITLTAFRVAVTRVVVLKLNDP